MSDAVRGLAGPPERFLPAAEAVTQRLLTEHPELLERYGERGRAFGAHDTAYQIAWIVNAIELGTGAALRRDVLWLRDLLVARGFPLAPFRRNLELAIAATSEHGFASAAEVARVTDGLLDEVTG